jgi:hypothetical protein
MRYDNQLKLLLKKIYVLLPIVLIGGEIQAADLLKLTTPLARGTATFSDAGALTLTSRRYFQNVDPARFPWYDRGLTLEFTDKVMAHIDGFIFLKGTLRKNQSSFPGSYLLKNASNQTVVSVDNSGNLYLKGGLTTSSACTVPPYEPTLWNDGSDIQGGDNCYNYGNNQITFTYAQPGRAAGYREWIDGSDMTVAYVRERAIADSLKWVGWNYPGAGYSCSGGGHLVFMAIAPGEDYHWWRKDNGTSYWSHKPASGSATNRDAANALITNPLTSNRNFFPFYPNYTDNGGFYCTCGNNANVR